MKLLSNAWETIISKNSGSCCFCHCFKLTEKHKVFVFAYEQRGEKGDQGGIGIAGMPGLPGTPVSFVFS